MDYFHGERGWYAEKASLHHVIAWCLGGGRGALYAWRLVLEHSSSSQCGMRIWNGNMHPGPCCMKCWYKVYWSVWKMFSDGWRLTGKRKYWNLSFQKYWESKLSRQYIVWEIASAKMAQKVLNRLYYRTKNSIICVCCFTICAVTTQHVTRKIWE